MYETRHMKRKLAPSAKNIPRVRAQGLAACAANKSMVHFFASSTLAHNAFPFGSNGTGKCGGLAPGNLKNAGVVLGLRFRDDVHVEQMGVIVWPQVSV
jgi:hypothetical protein